MTYHMIDLADVRTRNPEFPLVRVVPGETAKRVGRFMRDVLLPHTLRADALMYRTAQTGHARWIAGHILAHEVDRVTARDITRAYGALRAPECRKELSEVMQSLVIFGWLEPEDSGSALKPVNSWLVNPACHLFVQRAEAERETRRRTKEEIQASIQSLRDKSGF